MRIGIDFDNTIACYDRAFYKAALHRQLIPSSIDSSKDSVRNHLRAIGKENDWTILQGYIYGARMDLANPYPGVREFFESCAKKNIETVIISHKTKTPYLGPSYDLHKAAKDWLNKQPFYPNQAFFEPSLEKKLSRIDKLNCDFFIDDLPELLAEKTFPARVKKVLFDPINQHKSPLDGFRVTSWEELKNKIL